MGPTAIELEAVRAMLLIWATVIVVGLAYFTVIGLGHR
jgi:hypothetical protein